MSLQLEMLQAARLAPKLLGESAGLVRDFLLRQQNADGGFKDRAGKSDLYYTAFGLAGLAALDGVGQSTVHGPQSTVQSPRSTVQSPQSTVLGPKSPSAGFRGCLEVSGGVRG